MGKGNFPLYAFNRGVISQLGMARTDLKRMALSADTQTNFVPRVLGSMMLRAGWNYLDSVNGNNQAVHIKFIFSVTDTALIEFTNTVMRVRVNDTIITRPAVTSAVTNGTFAVSLTGWTTADEVGAASTHDASNMLKMVGNGFSKAITYQKITVGANANIEHGIHIVVSRGRVNLRIGSTLGGDEYQVQTTLTNGVHSLSITPTGDFYIWFSNYSTTVAMITSVAIEGAGPMTLTSPYLTAELLLIRDDQSADVIYLACNGHEPRKIERRAARSWSLVRYRPDDGPFRLPNITPITLTPSALNGDITLTASDNVFYSGHVGALFRIQSSSQTVQQTFTATNQESDYLLVNGVDQTPAGQTDGVHTETGTAFQLTITGTWVGKMKLQVSYGGPGNWVDYGLTWTSNVTDQWENFGSRDNQDIYCRIVTDGLTWTSGTANVTMTFSKGGIQGIVRILTVTNAKSATATVLSPLGDTNPTNSWSEGSWSTYRGYPTAVALDQGRLWWAGRASVYASISDAYESFDDGQVGDAGPINRSIGFGPVDVINFILPLQRIILGTGTLEISVRSTSLDEPITPTNFNMKGPSTQGSVNVGAVKIDNRGYFVNKSGSRIYDLEIDSVYMLYDYKATEVTLLCPDIGKPSVVKMGVQRQPDTRLHAVLSDGSVALLIVDPVEEVQCFIKITTNGVIEDVVVLPGTDEDQVYYVVKRTVNGGTVRYLEKWAKETECVGGALNKQADAFVTYTGAPSATITAAHLKGATVVVWGDGKYLGTAVANAGTGVVTLPGGVSCSNIMVGLGYTAQFKSTKLAYAAQAGTALNQVKMITHLGFIMKDTHYQGIQYGPDFNTLEPLPLVEGGAITPADTIWPYYDFPVFDFPGSWDTDSRLCLQAVAPLPCNLLAAVIGIETNEQV